MTLQRCQSDSDLGQRWWKDLIGTVPQDPDGGGTAPHLGHSSGEMTLSCRHTAIRGQTPGFDLDCPHLEVLSNQYSGPVCTVFATLHESDYFKIKCFLKKCMEDGIRGKCLVLEGMPGCPIKERNSDKHLGEPAVSTEASITLDGLRYVVKDS